MSGKKKLLIGLISFFLLLSLAVYVFGINYFSKHFLPGSSVNGYNCSYMTVEEAEELMNREAQASAIAVVTQGDGREAVTAREVGLVYSPDGSIQEMIRSQNTLTWFLQFSDQHTYDMSRSLSYDKDKMTRTVRSLKCMKPKEVISPTDAAIVEKNGEFVIVPEVPGNVLSASKVKKCISEAMLRGQTLVNLEEEGCYLRPKITSQDSLLNANCDTMNRLTSVVVTYDFGKRTEKVDINRIRQWLTYDQDGRVILDESLVGQFVEALAQAYNTVGTTRVFPTYNGGRIEISGGDFGWVINVAEETKALMNCIENGETQVRQPLYAQTAYGRDGINDIGYTYVEIDRLNQRLVYYEAGRPVIETFCVTGDTTPVGVYCAGKAENNKKITSGFIKTMPVMEIFSSDGTSSQGTANVESDDGVIKSATVAYWMPFSNVGITEGVARTQYGPEGAMLTGPTTGNVEIPPDWAGLLFPFFTEGLPVVVY